jgi:hypothetical protein
LVEFSNFSLPGFWVLRFDTALGPSGGLRIEDVSDHYGAFPFVATNIVISDAELLTKKALRLECSLRQNGSMSQYGTIFHYAQ